MKRSAVILSTLLIASVVPVAAVAGSGSYDHDVVQYQQEAISDLNRARWSPVLWSPDLAGVASRPPLAVNASLMASSNQRANTIATQDPPCVFGSDNLGHECPEGSFPDEVAVANGYPLPGTSHEANTIELYYAGDFEPMIAFSSAAAAATHRPIAFVWWDRIEIGVGLSDQDRHWTFHIGYRSAPIHFLTGTVFEDVDGNGHMDAGEGLAGVTVTVDGVGSVVTNGGGGYSIEVPAGSHTVTVSGGGFTGTSTGGFTMDGYNVGADFVSGVAEPVIRSYGLCAGLEPTILGTEGDDVIYGTPGDDIIYGGGGRDRIYGGDGNDVICGGAGPDVIKGNAGRDRIYGGAGRDRIYGGAGRDRISGGAHRDRIYGGPHRDRIYGGGGPDIIKGSGGPDIIKGNRGNDRIYGNRGRDRLDGGRALDGGPQTDSCINGEYTVNCEA